MNIRAHSPEVVSATHAQDHTIHPSTNTLMCTVCIARRTEKYISNAQHTQTFGVYLSLGRGIRKHTNADPTSSLLTGLGRRAQIVADRKLLQIPKDRWCSPVLSVSWDWLAGVVLHEITWRVAVQVVHCHFVHMCTPPQCPRHLLSASSI